MTDKLTQQFQVKDFIPQTHLYMCTLMYMQCFFSIICVGKELETTGMHRKRPVKKLLSISIVGYTDSCKKMNESIAVYLLSEKGILLITSK